MNDIKGYFLKQIDLLQVLDTRQYYKRVCIFLPGVLGNRNYKK